MTSLVDFGALAAHVLVAIAHARGSAVTLDDLSTSLGVRRADVRASLSQLHREGFLDAMKLRLTLPGLALAASLDGCKLRSFRLSAPARIIAA